MRRQRGVLLVLGVAAVLVPLLVAALGAQLVEALTSVTFVGHEEVPQVQAAHRFTCQHRTGYHGLPDPQQPATSVTSTFSK